jgi:hypothetical protein
MHGVSTKLQRRNIAPLFFIGGVEDGSHTHASEHGYMLKNQF